MKKENFKLDFVVKAIQASLLQQGEIKEFAGLSTDSREPHLKNKIFVALKAQRFDGHDFLNSALKKGAVAFIVSDTQKAQNLLQHKQVSVMKVSSPLKALQDLAKVWSQHLGTKLIAVTGSNGKTSTCSMAHALFFGENVFVSPKSYNNFIGVPLSLLSVHYREAFLIQEIGTSRPGEIAFLTELCDPFISAVTMVSPSHLEGLGSTELVAQEKQDIYLKSPKATWVFNQDNSWTNKMYKKYGEGHFSNLSFSLCQKKADVSLAFKNEKAQSSLVEGHIGSVFSSAQVSFSGFSNLENLMCACTLALAAKIDPQKIWNCIPYCQLPKGRQEWFYMRDQKSSILFDAYNANPSSMHMFLESFGKFSQPKQRILIIGDMKELGKDSMFYHKELASHPTLLQSRFVIFIGEYANLMEQELKNQGFKGECVSFQQYDKKTLRVLKERWKTDDFIGIKSSRSLKLDRLFFDLTGQKIF